MSLDLPILGWQQKGGSTTQGGPHVPAPQKPHLFTYSQPLFSGNAASFYGLVIPVSLGRRAIVGVPVWVSPFMTDIVPGTAGDAANSSGKKKKKKRPRIVVPPVTPWNDPSPPAIPGFTPPSVGAW